MLIVTWSGTTVTPVNSAAELASLSFDGQQSHIGFWHENVVIFKETQHCHK